jgi:hypothetical protein
MTKTIPEWRIKIILRHLTRAQTLLAEKDMSRAKVRIDLALEELIDAVVADVQAETIPMPLAAAVEESP